MGGHSETAARRSQRVAGAGEGLLERPGLRGFVFLNVLGGLAVLGSYVLCFASYPDVERFWGNVPEGWKPVYTTSMLLAAAGYFPFTGFLLMHVAAGEGRAFGRHGIGLFSLLYALILIPSALWMPLTFWLLESPSTGLWWLVRLDLFAVGLGAVGTLVAYLRLEAVPRGVFFWLGVLGLLAFCWQTAVLDALVWPAYFPV